MFEEIDLQIGEENTENVQFTFTASYTCGRTSSGGYGTSCKWCC